MTETREPASATFLTLYKQSFLLSRLDGKDRLDSFIALLKLTVMPH